MVPVAFYYCLVDTHLREIISVRIEELTVLSCSLTQIMMLQVQLLCSPLCVDQLGAVVLQVMLELLIDNLSNLADFKLPLVRDI